uniref:Uncharacterized protein n=1 Tax=Chromera velia CCMP2878 TaxID=1169474 RepID=A0A0G4IEP6_9ALVE|eukprot:Cvel_13777.t1-p1 / transcript=Cvel_13777.t1 / gene=Cvel_13777 / organism=Chromera_velia_CCMP2878 / gene_product=hypothetical protein / transcript_product=hypothetical protein / location=Cvel_scaffold954:44654-45277(+) / protein_length=208 / sequence_SO=supercontig / SO=protein_coding / is_pseudo=false
MAMSHHPYVPVEDKQAFADNWAAKYTCEGFNIRSDAYSTFTIVSALIFGYAATLVSSFASESSYSFAIWGFPVENIRMGVCLLAAIASLYSTVAFALQAYYIKRMVGWDRADLLQSFTAYFDDIRDYGRNALWIALTLIITDEFLVLFDVIFSTAQTKYTIAFFCTLAFIGLAGAALVVVAVRRMGAKYVELKKKRDLPADTGTQVPV